MSWGEAWFASPSSPTGSSRRPPARSPIAASCPTGAIGSAAMPRSLTRTEPTSSRRCPPGSRPSRAFGAARSCPACWTAPDAVPTCRGAPVLAAEYTLESVAAYDVRPDEGVIGVTVGLTMTNTTPDPAGQFSIFSEIKVAIHDAAAEVAATDADGDLTVSTPVESEVNVATIELREDLRFEETATLELTYTLPDSDNPQQRVRPSVVVFPAWSFGTAGEVSVSIPNGYELRVDGDPLTEEGDRLTSGPIPNPGEWLALVTAIRPAEYTDFTATVPLEGGTADLLVRSFA